VIWAGCIDSERRAAAFLTFRKLEFQPLPLCGANQLTLCIQINHIDFYTLMEVLLGTISGSGESRVFRKRLGLIM
jgi:hypothetical protein